MRAYKHVPENFAAAFLAGTSIKLGTLEHYRELEHDRADRREGVTVATIDHFQSTGLDPVMRRRLEAVNLINLGPGASPEITINDSRFSMIHPSVMIFCASLAPDENERAKGNRIFEIQDFALFARMVGDNCDLSLSSAVTRTVSYGTRIVDLTREDALPVDPFMKDPEYAYENEIRAVWAPKRETALPATIIVSCPATAELITEV